MKKLITVIALITLSFVGYSQENKTNIYVNPSLNEIEISSKMNIKMIEIYNINGLLVDRIKVDSNVKTISVNTLGLTRGLYFLKMTTRVGTITTKNIIKK